MKKLILLFVLVSNLLIANGQQLSWDAARILLELQKLNTTGSVLYLAAHPDDENTRLITYFANDKKVRTGYLSLTRGDGGQNLIGEEQGAYLGLIRTQELLQARATDGGEQFFTRAVDFGYSKSATETFSKWNHDSILSDVVWVIRNFRPDIIITRFPPDARAGHGQHTVSAILAEEAFDAAADPNKFPEQLKYVEIWQAKRLFWNNSVWWDKDLADKILNNKSLFQFDDGGYNALLGKSYGEIAADSRTHHKSQGFGSTPTRGTTIEYIELNKGEAFDKDIFENINTTWLRFEGGDIIQKKINTIIQSYNSAAPELSIDALLELSSLLENIASMPEIDYKKKQLENIIIACLGLWIEPVVEKDFIAEGSKINIISTSLKRVDFPLSLESISINGLEVKVGEILPKNTNQIDTILIQSPIENTSPYWLNGHYEGLFKVDNILNIGKAQNSPSIDVIYNIKIGNQHFFIHRALVYKETDAVKGEIYKPVEIVPNFTANFDSKVLVFNNAKPQKIQIHLQSFSNFVNGKLILDIGKGWKVEPPVFSFKLDSLNKFLNLEFTITPPEIVSESTMNVFFSDAKDMPSRNETNKMSKFIVKSLSIIQYDHIPRQIILEDSKAKLVKMNVQYPEIKIGYIEGAGDKVLESLSEVGLNISAIDLTAFNEETFKKYDVVLIGVKAYNTSNELIKAYPMLMQYIQNGGLVIAQYSNQDLLTDMFGPYKFDIGRGRVTNENSPFQFLDSTAQLLNFPNKIMKEDFNGWVQERGLYFAEKLAPEYKTVLSFTDPNEKPQEGSIIVCDFGKGAYIYTGISFFRELPMGVSGAYKLLANLLAYKSLKK